jgi:apolipoprotein N-acyltransferase
MRFTPADMHASGWMLAIFAVLIAVLEVRKRRVPGESPFGNWIWASAFLCIGAAGLAWLGDLRPARLAVLVVAVPVVMLAVTAALGHRYHARISRGIDRALFRNRSQR